MHLTRIAVIIARGRDSGLLLTVGVFNHNTITQMAAGRTFVRNKNWTNTHHVADVVARYQKTFFDKLDVGILAGASQEKDNVKWFEAEE